MPTRRWRGIGPLDPAFLVVLLVTLWRVRPTDTVQWAMVAFALLVLVGSWLETRRLLARSAASRREYAIAVGLTVLLLAIWYAIAIQPSSSLARYFGLLATFFFCDAIRDVLVLSKPPIQLLLEGYASLVAVCLVLGAAADAVTVFEVGLVAIAFFVYVVRKSFQWTGTVIRWIAGGSADS